MQYRFSWRTNRCTLRYNRRSEGGRSDEKMERFRLFGLQSLQFFLLAELASDFPERRLLGLRVHIESIRRILRRARRAIIFLRAFISLGFDLRAVFRSQDVGMFEIFFGVNMLGPLLQFFFASAFLTGGFGDALILLVLRAGNGCAENREAQKNNSGWG